MPEAAASSSGRFEVAPANGGTNGFGSSPAVAKPAFGRGSGVSREVSAIDRTTGIALMEVYDLTVGAAGQRLTNLSTRGAVGNGANALLCGLYVAGTQPKRLLIRGVGPGLAAFGDTGVVAKPVLTLYRGTTQVSQNTGWETSADAVAIITGALEANTFALTPGSADSAILVNLAPGLYTAQVTSLDASAGQGLIEIYELP